MKCHLFVAGAVVSCSLSALAAAAPPSAVLKQYRERGEPERALELIDKIRSERLASATDPSLGYEAALSACALWRRTPGSSSTAERARRESADFLKASRSDPKASEIALELARTVAFVGKTRLGRVASEEDDATRLGLQKEARTLFQEADGRFADAAVLIGGIGAPRVAIEQAANLLELARTCGTTLPETVRHTQTVARAAALLRPLAEKKGDLAWEAKTWLGRCHFEMDDPQKALAQFKEVIFDGGARAEPARRLARYFRMLVYSRNPELYRAVRGDAIAELVKSGEEWLQAYPTDLDSPEGRGVRFLLAGAYLKEAAKTNRAKSPDQGERLYAQALALYDAVARGDDEYALWSRQARMSILVALADKASHVDAERLTTFEECYLRAQVELRNLAGLAPNTKNLREDEPSRRQGRQAIARVLERGLDLLRPDTAAEDVQEARALLAHSYLSLGDLHRAAALGDAAAREHPQGRAAARAALAALQAYGQLLADEQGAGIRTELVETDSRMLRALATLAEEKWPRSQAADLGRHQLGALATRDRQIGAAIALLSRITPAYGGYTAAQVDLANACILAHDANFPPAPGGAPFLDQAIAALKRVPEPLDTPAPEAVRTYVHARLRLARIFYATKRFEELATLGERVARELANGRVRPADERDRQALEELPYYGIFVRADQAFRAGRFTDARVTLASTLERLAMPDSVIRNVDLRRGLLGLALRVEIRVGDRAKAREFLGLLANEAGGEKQKTSEILAEVFEQLRSDVEALRRQQPARKGELDEAISRLSAFLDDLAPQALPGGAPETLRFLAFGYAAIGRHDKAAEVLGKALPQTLSHPDVEVNELAIKLLLARELRLSRQFDAASKALAEARLTELGRRSLELRYEEIHLLEDRDAYPQAIREWDRLVRTLRGALPRAGEPQGDQGRANDAKAASAHTALAKEQQRRADYLDCQYQLISCLAHYAARTGDPERRSAIYQRAAAAIVRLEQSSESVASEDLQIRFAELMKEHPELKTHHDQIAGAKR